MKDKYIDFLNSIDESFGKKTERYVLILGFFVIGYPLYFILILLHLKFAGLKKSDYDIATTYIPLFALSHLLVFTWIFSLDLTLLRLSMGLAYVIYAYILGILFLDLIGEKALLKKITFKIIPMKQSWYQRRTINKPKPQEV